MNSNVLLIKLKKMYKTNDIHSLILMQNKNSKSSNKNKTKEQKDKYREINPFNLRNRINLSLKSMTQFQIEKPPVICYH